MKNSWKTPGKIKFNMFFSNTFFFKYFLSGVIRHVLATLFCWWIILGIIGRHDRDIGERTLISY